MKLKTMVDVTQLESDLPTMTLFGVARVVRDDWKKMSPHALPYLLAMMNADFGLDGEKSVLLYFLSNASTWRGPVARLVKKELNRRTK